jgi:hypothetical protein
MTNSIVQDEANDRLTIPCELIFASSRQ